MRVIGQARVGDEESEMKLQSIIAKSTGRDSYQPCSSSAQLPMA